MREGRSDSMDHRQETEANQFAINLLAPPLLMGKHLNAEPDLRDIMDMRDGLAISLEAAARRYVECHDAQLAAVFSQDGKVRYLDRQPGFPWINLSIGGRLNPDCPAARFASRAIRGVSDMEVAQPLWWMNPSDVELTEQTRLGRDGQAVTLLWATRPANAEDDEDDDGGLEELDMPRFR
jgi:hypothetical protein